MDRNDIRAAGFHVLHIPPRLLHHHMDIKNSFCTGTQAPDDRHPKGDARDEGTVHDVNVQVLCTGSGDRLDVLAETGKIGGQD